MAEGGSLAGPALALQHDHEELPMSDEQSKYVTVEAAEAFFERANDEVRRGLEDTRQRLADATPDHCREAVLEVFDRHAENIRLACARTLVVPKDKVVHVHDAPDGTH